MNKAAIAITFASGFAAGAYLTLKYVDKRRGERSEYDDLDERTDVLAEAKDEYADVISKNGYSGKEPEPSSPYVIPPDEFGEKDGYEKISFTYYGDGVLADENGEPATNADNLIGLGNLEHFGEYEDDSVFVRNDVLKCDYEILRDYRNFKDIPGSALYRVLDDEDKASKV